MAKTLLLDFSRVLIFPKQRDVKSLNAHNRQLAKSIPGYKLLDYFELNIGFLNYLEQLKEIVPISILTDGQLHEQNEVRPYLEGIFQHIYTAQGFGFDKKQPDVYITVAAKLGYDPSDIVFVDDKSPNVMAAARAGLHAMQFITNDQIFADLRLVFTHPD